MKSLEELKAIRDRAKANVHLRKENSPDNIRVVVGMATCGIAAGARPVLAAFTEEVAKRGLENVMVTQTGCIGLCQYEPIVEVYQPDGKVTTYVKMTPIRLTASLPNIWSTEKLWMNIPSAASAICNKEAATCIVLMSWSVEALVAALPTASLSSTQWKRRSPRPG